MQATAIIAEFNPWHHGHEWLIDSVRQKLNPEVIITAMSGNFTQRGEPAIADKWVRTQMALAGGIDLVLELPVLSAVRSSSFFAHGAIKLLWLAGAQELAFSCEHPDLTLLKELASCFNEEPSDYQQALKSKINSGYNMAQARAEALVESCYGNDQKISAVLSSPNNILAISYLQTLEKLNWPLTPVAFQRQGSGYHSLEITAYPSATAVRHQIQTDAKTTLENLLPSDSAMLLTQALQNKLSPPRLDIYTYLLLYKLRTMNPLKLKNIYEMENGLENRLLKLAHQSFGYEGLLQALKTKRYPYTRLQRLLFYVLFDIEKEKITAIDTKSSEYLRVLGYSLPGARWLKSESVKTDIILRRGKDLRALLNSGDDLLKYQLEVDIKASSVYDLLHPEATANRSEADFTQPALLTRL